MSNKNKEIRDRYNKEYYSSNIEYFEKYRQDNKGKISEYNKQRYPKIKAKRKEYLEKNKEAIKVKHREYINKREKVDINFKIANRIRARLNKIVSGKQKSGSAVDDLGCTIPELIKHLESKFTEGMSWDKYGEIHIDHIKPLSKFDLSNKEQFLEACHYTNLQPLWHIDNIIKSNN